ncbi:MULTISPECIES: aldehyde dehydrogenase [Nocardia]|uniref:aldehyde dehydrogenase family protein n=1 Tax=Nocardia TaxID=1817 RepID=UPI0007EBDCA4|nr:MULTISPECIES: aldehyde dehydrogenase family protein [Nocardia]MBF6278424.1 aldehyde dehydrogenase family protein [Nocardia nova]OBA50507.1 betaine-aldehyde dehydrogenase [Nocardia sp. 852002-51101_SCH5132738]OBB45401.1 betaine-aldehyde dehydrogenase [Nocardia sp. 852002-51244_SCH5132740]OBF69663.1 betaine-aldehyde dehydrogenase [Mycobacterium sp. 852002-51759_SCH5129042]
MTTMSVEVPESVRTFIQRAAASIVVDGRSATAAGGELPTTDPATGAVLGRIAAGGAPEVGKAVASARSAIAEWNALSAAARGRILLDIADLIDANAEELAILETLDNGKPLTESLYLDVGLAAQTWRYFAGWTTKLGGRTVPVSPPVGDAFVYTCREPLGVVGAIVPWNFPLMIASWKVAPALAAGNTVVLKPSEFTSLSALRLVELALEAGLPAGVLNLVTGLGSEAGQALIEHPDVAKISFTGSTVTGRRIARTGADSLKSLTLELGGKSANIVFPDADISSAADGAFNGVFLNQGQVCCAGTRLFVHRDVHDELVAALESAADAVRLGHGLSDDTDMGPLVSQVQLERVEAFVKSGRSQGATLVCGGDRPVGSLSSGHFLKPTVFTDVRDDMEIATEEIFGPVLSVLTFDDEDEVLYRANASTYGLAAGVWTNDLKRAHRMSARLQAGTVWVNTYNMIDPAAPFGGYKASGHGRDLGEESLLGYTQTKSVWIDLG